MRRVVVGVLSGLITDVDAAHQEVRSVKKLLHDCDVVAQYQGSLAWLIWADDSKQQAARNRIEMAIAKREYRYLSVAGSRTDGSRVPAAAPDGAQRRQ